jgi:3-oxoacyl-[acyl-carrier protein] reductase
MEAVLKNKTAIVTVASRGIGRAIGASVVVNYARNAKAADEVVSQIAESGGQAVSVQADMQKTSEVSALFDAAGKHFGSIHILVNNAGIALFKKIADFTEKEFDDSFAVNVKGLFFACQQAAPKMTDGGKIIKISSSVTKMMLPDYSLWNRDDEQSGKTKHKFDGSWCRGGKTVVCTDGPQKRA